MTILSPTNLETITYRQQGWNAITASNMQRLNTLLTPLMNIVNSSTGSGETVVSDNDTTLADITTTVADITTTVADNDSQTQTAKTMETISGTGDDTNINANFSEISDALEEIRADNAAMNSKINEIIDYVDEVITKIHEVIDYCEEIDSHGASNVDYCDDLKTTLNSLLSALRISTGCGILSD